MAKLIFNYSGEMLEECREASHIEMTIPDDFDIHEYKVICMRMAAAMGFTESTIKESFGKTLYDIDAVYDNQLDIEFNNFLKSTLLNYSSSNEH
jgi:hypothetical protein